MNNERSLTDRLMETLEAGLPKSRVIKHSDRFTSGIPDVSCSWRHATSWLEIKRLKPTEIVFDQLDPDQLVECFKLQRACDRAWVIAYQQPRRGSNDDGATLIYSPKFLMQHKDSRNGLLLHPDHVDTDVDVRKLWEQGVLHFRGYNHESVMTLIAKTHL